MMYRLSVARLRRTATILGLFVISSLFRADPTFAQADHVGTTETLSLSALADHTFDTAATRALSEQENLPVDRRAGEAVSLAAVSEQTSGGGMSKAGVPLPVSGVRDGMSDFSLANVEQISLRILGYSELSGTYKINPNQTISVPGLGRVSVADMSPTELEAVLGRRLSTLARKPVTVAVEVAQFRPYFIMGQIAEPGANQWKPGTILIQAISMSGGVSVPSPERVAQQSESGSETERARSELRYALTRLARLKAQRDDRTTIDMSGDLATVLNMMRFEGRTGTKAYVAHQNDVLTEQRSLQKMRMVGLERAHTLAVNDHTAARQQLSATEKQLKISAKRTRDLKTLKDQGYGIDARYHAQRSEEMGVRVRLSRARSVVTRTRASMVTTERQIAIERQRYRADLNTRIEGVEREVSRLRASLPFGQQHGNGVNARMGLNYHIARKSADGVKTIVATLFTEVLPDDVILISAKPRSTAAADLTNPVDMFGSDALARTQRIMESTAGTPRNTSRTSRSSVPSN